MKFSALTMILSLSLLASCGGSGGGGGSKSKSSNGLSTSSDVEEFKGRCQYNSEVNAYSISVVKVTLSDSVEEMLLRDDIYTDSRCSSPVQLSIELPLEGSFGESDFEGQTNGVYYRPRTKEFAKAMNRAEVCGLENWSVNRAVLVSDCNPDFTDSNVHVELSDDGKSVTVSMCSKEDIDESSCEKFVLKK